MQSNRVVFDAVLSKCEGKHLQNVPIEDPPTRIHDISNTDESDGVPVQEPPTRDNVLSPTESMCADSLQPTAAWQFAVWKLQCV